MRCFERLLLSEEQVAVVEQAAAVTEQHATRVSVDRYSSIFCNESDDILALFLWPRCATVIVYIHILGGIRSLRMLLDIPYARG